ncbi:MAG: CBS domain-containing protein [Sphingosinicella sp.]
MKVSDCMTRDVQMIEPNQPISQAAQFMLKADTGSLPVSDGDRLVGMITDRDIAVRAVADGRGPETPVKDVMTDEVLYCYEDQTIDEIARNMSEQQVRRLPVLNRDKRLVGIISLGDLARHTDDESAHVALDGVTEPSTQHNQSAEG